MHARAMTMEGTMDPEVRSDRSRRESLDMQEQTAALTTGDGFQRALLLEQSALHDALMMLPRQAQERLVPVVGELYAMLRTPIFPKGSYRAIADALVKAVEEGDNRVLLYGILASPTAMAEIGPFLKCADIFRKNGFAPHLRFLLVQWENLLDVSAVSPAVRARTFAQQVLTVSQAAQHAGFGNVVLPVAVEIDSPNPLILNPTDFRDWSHRIIHASQDPRNASARDARDVAWSSQFYARQRSLSRLGEQQALLDLAIRRAVGDRISAEYAAEAQMHAGLSAMLTSELHKRFLPCYAVSLPIFNLDVRTAAPLGVPAVA